MTKTTNTTAANVSVSIDSKKINIDSSLHINLKGLKVSSKKNWSNEDGSKVTRTSDDFIKIDSMDMAIGYKEDLAGVLKIATDLKRKGVSEILADLGNGVNPISENCRATCSVNLEGVVLKENDKNKPVAWVTRDGKTTIDESVDRCTDMELESMEIGGHLNSVIDAMISLIASCTTEEKKTKEQLDAEKAAAEKERREWLNGTTNTTRPE